MWSVLSELGARRKGRRTSCSREIELRFSVGSRRPELEGGPLKRTVLDRTLARDLDAGRAEPGWPGGKWNIESSRLQ
jgi:hypothetical protein